MGFKNAGTFPFRTDASKLFKLLLLKQTYKVIIWVHERHHYMNLNGIHLSLARILDQCNQNCAVEVKCSFKPSESLKSAIILAPLLFSR